MIRIDRWAEVVNNLKYGAGSYAFALNSQGVPIIHPDRPTNKAIDSASVQENLCWKSVRHH